MSQLLCLAKRCEEAISHLKAIVNADPGLYFAHQSLGTAYLALGRYKEALDSYHAAEKIQSNEFIVGLLANAHARAGNRVEAEMHWKQLQQLRQSGAPNAAGFAFAAAAMRTKEEAINWLLRACQDREDTMTWVGSEPIFDPLRSHPRYAEVLQCTGVTPLRR